MLRQHCYRQKWVKSVQIKLWIFLVLTVLTGLIFLLCCPQLYYFNDKIKYKNFCVYYDKKLPIELYSVLDTVDELVRKSELYDPKLNFKIFLRSDANKYNRLPFQFPDSCSAWVIPVIKNVFLYQSDPAMNTSYNHVGDVRVLTSVLAHELTHVMVENKKFLKSKMAYFDADSNLEFGLWKEEGYAEYIAGGSSIALEEGLKILGSEDLLEHAYASHRMEYFKYWFAVRYLIQEKSMTFKEILDAKLKFDDVLREARYFVMHSKDGLS